MQILPESPAQLAAKILAVIHSASVQRAHPMIVGIEISAQGGSPALATAVAKAIAQKFADEGSPQIQVAAHDHPLVQA